VCPIKTILTLIAGAVNRERGRDREIDRERERERERERAVTQLCDEIGSWPI